MLGKKEPARREEGALTAWRPFREMERDIKDLMSATIEEFLGNGHGLKPIDAFGGKAWAPAVDVEESEKEYTFEVELPGLEKNDFKVELQSGTLVISGERREAVEHKGRTCLRHEQYYGQFRRAFSMPVDAVPEGIKAAYKNGILTVTVPRSEKAKPKAIPVHVE